MTDLMSDWKKSKANWNKPPFVALLSTGRFLRDKREYPSREAARAAALRWERAHPGEFLSEVRSVWEQQPHKNDAEGWDLSRLLKGYAAR